MAIDNPFEEEVAPARRLKPEAPPSKHRKGRQPKMTDGAKRRRTRAVKARIQDYLNRKALENAE